MIAKINKFWTRRHVERLLTDTTQPIKHERVRGECIKSCYRCRLIERYLEIDYIGKNYHLVKKLTLAPYRDLKLVKGYMKSEVYHG